MSVGVGEVRRGPEGVDFGLFLVDGLEDAGVEDGSFGPGVYSHQQYGVGVFDVFDLGVEEVVGAELIADFESVFAPELVVEAVEGVEKVLHALDAFDALKLPDGASDLAPLHLIQAVGHDVEDVLPSLLREILSLPEQRGGQPLLLQPVEGLPGFVRQPLLVNRLVHSGVHPHDVVVLVVYEDVAAQGVHHIDGLCRLQLIGAGGVGEWAVIQSSYRANVCQISAQLGKQ